MYNTVYLQYAECFKIMDKAEIYHASRQQFLKSPLPFCNVRLYSQGI